MTSAGQEAVELAASAGLHLDPWQQAVLSDALGERKDGKWSAFEVGLVVPRQCGKGSILEARELAGLFLFGEQLILHSSHEFKTAQEGFRRILALVDNTDHLRRRVKRVRTSHGEEGIELTSGARLRFVARSTGSGRGFSGDCVILDEAYQLSEDAMAALLPTLSARPNPQIWYTSSAPLESSEVLRKLCLRGRSGESKRLAYMEFCADDTALLDDPAAWAEANPALGIRIDADFIEAELAALGETAFRRERLGIWDEAGHSQVIPSDIWAAGIDTASAISGALAFAVDVAPDRSTGALAVAGARGDGLIHMEVVDYRPGTGWIAERMQQLHQRWKPAAIVLDAAGPAGSLLAAFADRGLEISVVSSREMGQACGLIFDDLVEGRIRHLNQPSLNAAIAGVKKRPLGDAWAWARRTSDVDISPLVAATLARHAYAVHAAAGVDVLSTAW